MRITAKGQVTIPREIRERAGLNPGAEVEFEIENGVVRLLKSRDRGASRSRGQRIVDSLIGGDFKMSTDEVIALMRGPPADER